MIIIIISNITIIIIIIKVKIDYEKLIGRLNRDLQLLSKRQNKDSDDNEMMIKRIEATRSELFKKLSDINDKNDTYNADEDDNYIINSNEILKQSRANIINNNLISDSEAETIKGNTTAPSTLSLANIIIRKNL
jgi:hypothetical protein